MSSEVEIQTEVQERLSGDAARLACAGWLELSEKGWTDAEPTLHGGLPCILARIPDGRQMVAGGVIVFHRLVGSIFAYVSYVAPEFRGRGVYRAMYDALIAEAMNSGKPCIDSNVSASNTTMRAIAKKFGRTEDFITIRHDLR